MAVNRVHDHAFETTVQTEAMIEMLQDSIDRMRVELDRSHHLLFRIATALGTTLGVDRMSSVAHAVEHRKPSPLPKATARMRKP